MMLDDFLKFIDQRNLCQAGDRILAATSGGIDSMVMLDLFVNAGYDVGIAHCNFQLRGSDSDADERLVKKSAERLAAPYYVKCFNTRRYSREHGISIQMAARKLRYVWLEEIRRHHGYNFISTGHHLNDSIETLLFNLIRGTGLRGLTGIPVKQGNVIRPLLFATKDQIVSYAEDKEITFREDLSNIDTKYKRNLIRKEILPVIEQVNPGFLQTMLLTLERLKETQKIIEYWLDAEEGKFMQKKGSHIYLKRSYFRETGSPVLLHEVLRKWDFQYDQSIQILRNTGEVSGRLFFSKTHVLNIDRDHMIISPRMNQEDVVISWDEQDTELNTVRGRFTKEIISRSEVIKTRDPHVEYFDLEKIKFPLVLRSWRKGDWFIPLGMSGKKKLSDFMIDEKIPVNLKKRLPVLLSGNTIIWVVGYRMDERFKLEPESSRILKITYMSGDDQSF